MFSFKIHKKSFREAIVYAGIAMLVLILSLLSVQAAAAGNPMVGNIGTEPTEPPPSVEELPPPVGPDRDEAKCKMLVYPRTIILGEPFEVCWVGHKFSDVALGPDRSLTPSEPNAYLTTLENGKTLWCHSYLVPSSSNTFVNPGVYDFRCAGPGGTILATTVSVVDPVSFGPPQ